MANRINTLLMSLHRRAENSAREKLISTFVDVGSLFTLLSSTDHQILYGRRGTGKTHALTYLADNREEKGDAVVSVDLRNVGSSGGLYADLTRTIEERATCLLVDTLSAVYEKLYEYSVENSDVVDLAQAGPALDGLAEAMTQVRVIGRVEAESMAQAEGETKDQSTYKIGVGMDTIGASASSRSSRRDRVAVGQTVRQTGTEMLTVNFGSLGAAVRRLIDQLNGKRIWILLDEWSSVPLDLQPLLADLLRRSVLSAPLVTVKIAAIEQRSQFLVPRAEGDYLGIEVGADASADVNLDDFMVFDNAATRAEEFFRNLVFRHFMAAADASDDGNCDLPQVEGEFVRLGFTQRRAFEEFVRAAEGVPRDGINILSLAAQRANEAQISIEHIRSAATAWYQRDKDNAVRANERAQELLSWIIHEVIGERRARAFLLRSNVSDKLIDDLYDARVLHVLKRGIATHDQPGIRYDVFKLDYGCYVDLVNTARSPQGLLPKDSEDGAAYVEVPPDDYRSIRRAILDLSEFPHQPQ